MAGPSYAYSQTTHFIISTSTLLKKILKAITSYLLDTVMRSTRFLHLPVRSFGPSTAVTLVLTWAEVPISSGSTMPAGSTTTLRSAFSTMPPVHGNLTRGWQGVSYWTWTPMPCPSLWRTSTCHGTKLCRRVREVCKSRQMGTISWGE